MMQQTDGLDGRMTRPEDVYVIAACESGDIGYSPDGRPVEIRDGFVYEVPAGELRICDSGREWQALINGWHSLDLGTFTRSYDTFVSEREKALGEWVESFRPVQLIKFEDAIISHIGKGMGRKTAGNIALAVLLFVAVQDAIDRGVLGYRGGRLGWIKDADSRA